MKKALLALPLLAALALGGCATQFGTRIESGINAVATAVSIGTASIANPVTPTRLNQIESSATLVFAGLNAWRTSCVQGLIPSICKAQIGAVQVYSRQIPPYLTQLRAFVRNNDQVNAITVFNELTSLITTVKSQAAAGGVAVGG